jgi:hypothetical protein
MTTDQMVEQLTKKELEFLADHPEWINDSVKFFIDGGYKQYPDSEIQFMYNRDIAEEIV